LDEQDDVADLPQPSDPQPDRAASTCFGYTADSSLPLTVCRPGPGQPLTIAESDLEPTMADPPLLEWHEAGRPFARLWVDAPVFTLWIDAIGWFRIDRRGPSIVAPASSGGIRREARLWGVPAALCFMERGDLPLHAACVDIGGAGVLLAAPGRHGKTTLAAALMQAGHRLLAEDLTCVRPRPRPAVLPGPALLRVRKDVFAELSFDAPVVDEDDTRMYVVPDEAARGTGDAVELRAAIFLRTHEADEVRLDRVDAPGDALRDFWTLSFNLPTDEDRARCFDGIAQLAATVPIWNLTRPLTYASLPRVVHAIEELVS
jgi:hypothetical protein